MAAAPAPVIPKQFDIEIGPWTPAGDPTQVVPLLPIHTNSNHVRCQLTPGIDVGIMFSRGGFLTSRFETPEDERTVWLINLVPVKKECFMHVPNVTQLQGGELHDTGSLFWMRWNHFFIFQNEANQAVTIRVVDRQPQSPGSRSPIHYHGGNPILRLTSHADVPNLLSRLHTLTI